MFEHVASVARYRLDERSQVLSRVEQRLSFELDSGTIHERHPFHETRVEAEARRKFRVLAER
jgi:hypothetical protein